MRTDTTNDVRRQLYALLNGRISIASPYPGGAPRNLLVVDEVGTTPLPYIQLGAATEVPDDGLSEAGSLVETSVHTWSAYQGFAEVGIVHKRIIEALADLHDADLPVLTGAGYKDISIKITNTAQTRDEDPKYRHGIIDLAVRLNQEGS